MDKEKLTRMIEERKNGQVDKYVDNIKEIVKKYPGYYKSKDYAKKFLK